ncbi:MAG: N-acetyl-gamma-glutamyl-phosphate reductase [Olsenella sp.]|nr:N-acetyl-gamma-glutamyl-phosphate reductase [Olsenella sp.]
MEDKIRICIVGATGYVGVEAARLVCGHPCMCLAMATDRKAPGTRLSDHYPALVGTCDIALSLPDPERIAESADVALLAVPQTTGMGIAPALLDAGVSVVDLSGDYRLGDARTYARWYGAEHSSPELLADAVYGLPELTRARLADLAARREAGEAVLVATPGCYPTAAALAAAPVLEAGMVAGGTVVVDGISGVSGAGRACTEVTHFCRANESVGAYGAVGHRHTPEIEQTLSRLAGREVPVSFTPHLAPLTRGLVATVHLELAAGVTCEKVRSLYEERYAGEPLVDVLPDGAMPQTAHVAGSARAQVGVALDYRRCPRLVASCAIDNLGKGSAAQAIQCANLVCGIDETAGLLLSAPVV